MDLPVWHIEQALGKFNDVFHDTSTGEERISFTEEIMHEHILAIPFADLVNSEGETYIP